MKNMYSSEQLAGEKDAVKTKKEKKKAWIPLSLASLSYQLQA